MLKELLNDPSNYCPHVRVLGAWTIQALIPETLIEMS